MLPSQESASLVKRLAGPSTGKAGLAKDQSEINRIISETSKGSKFYENEKKKDKDLTERISRILKQRDDALKEANIGKIEATVDHLLIELESQRDLSQIIVHVDMDAFYCNVELLHNPDLQGKPFGVGRGVLTTASYEARKYGVRSGMAGFIAKKLCPHLIFVPINISRYSDMSAKVMPIFRRYDPQMLAASCDEGYLNITAYCQTHGLSAEACVQLIRKVVHNETGLTVSAGIAPNKMLAKICSDKNKPNGQFQLPFDRDSIKTFMSDLSIRKIPGVGRVNERLLESIGVKTCGDIFTHRASIYLMDKQFGLRFLLRTYLGIASNVVQPHAREERKSIGAERTFNTLGDKDKILLKLEEVAYELEKDMEDTGWAGRTVTLKYKLDTYQVFTRAKSFDRWITKKDDLYATGKELLFPELPLNLRLIGLRVTKLKDLRATTSSHGIKRFFESVGKESLPKRQKLEHNVVDLDAAVVDENDNDRDEHEETMPGFHEHDESDHTMTQEDFGDDDDDQVDDILPDHRTLVSSSALAGATNSHSTDPIPKKSSTLRSYAKSSNGRISASPLPDRKSDVEIAGTVLIPSDDVHECPICAKALRTNNDGLNAHIDFCLSRGAIWDAQAEATSPKKPVSAGSLQWPMVRGNTESTIRRSAGQRKRGSKK